jgi:hypothetical protein
MCQRSPGLDWQPILRDWLWDDHPAASEHGWVSTLPSR